MPMRSARAFWRFGQLAVWHLLSSLGGAQLQAQFVTLEGKQFKLDDEDFYPMVMNFSVALVRNASFQGTIPASAIYMASDASHGPSATFDCDDQVECNARLLADFQKVRQMGFNTVRIVNAFEPKYRDTPELGPDERRYAINVSRHPFLLTTNGVPNHDAGRVFIDLEEDLDGPYTLRYRELMMDLLDIAQAADLKVILLAVGRSNKNIDEGRRAMYPTFDETAVGDYANYLDNLTTALDGHPALLAYDLFNEPHYFQMEYQGAVDESSSSNLLKWKKEDICNFTTQWYETIKQNAPDQLVTLGGLGAGDLEVWDPAVLRLDFYSLHLYPNTDYMKNWDHAGALAHYWRELHWFGKICHMPWIIGETGYTANDRNDPQYLPHVGVGPQYHQWPYMQGTEADQAEFVAFSLEKSRASGASGWSWWMFQEWRWWHVYFDEPYLAFDLQEDAYMGLLHLGDQNADWYDKLAVSVVQNYTPAPFPQEPASEPPNYFNPYDLPTIPWLTGTVQNTNGEALQDVDARIWCKSRLFGNTDDLFALETFHNAFTDEEGALVFYKEPQTPGYVTPEYQNLVVVGRGTESSSHGTWNGTPINEGAMYPKETHPYLFNGLWASVDINNVSQETQYYHAWSDLLVRDVTVLSDLYPGTSPVEVAARNSIHVTTSFHAQASSTVHLRTLGTFPDCGADAFKSILAEPSPGSSAVSNRAAAGPARLELSFMPNESNHSIRAFPNPFHRKVEVHTSEIDEPVWLEVRDGMGRLIHSEQATAGGRSILSLDELAPGPYYLHVRGVQHIWSSTLVKQP